MLALMVYGPSCATAQSSGRLVLTAGQQIPVNSLDINNDRWRVASPIFHSTADVQPSAIGALRLDNPKSDDREELFRFQLTSGEVIVGQFVSMDDQVCVIQHFDLGAVTVQNDQLICISPVASGLPMFTVMDREDANCNGGSSGTGAIQLAQGQDVKCPLAVKPDAAVSVLFHSQADTDFRILLRSEKKS